MLYLVPLKNEDYLLCLIFKYSCSLQTVQHRGVRTTSAVRDVEKMYWNDKFEQGESVSVMLVLCDVIYILVSLGLRLG